MLSTALVIWTGYGQASGPARDEQLLVDQVGTDAATEMLPRIRALVDDFYASNARFKAPDLPSAGCRAVNHLGLTGSDPLQG
jgi:hypothetical protein